MPPKLRVVADALNVRRTPSLRGSIIGLLHWNDIVEGLESEHAAWQKVQKGDMIGWSSRRYLVPFEPDAPARRFDEILQIASTSAIALYKWKDRGVAPLGRCRSAWLYQGYALFARMYCKLKAGDPPWSLKRSAWKCLCCFSGLGCVRVRADIVRDGTDPSATRQPDKRRQACFKQATTQRGRILCYSRSSSNIWQIRRTLWTSLRKAFDAQLRTWRTLDLVEEGSFKDSRRSGRRSLWNSPA